MVKCEINFDTPDATYSPGQILRADIELTLSSPLKVRGIYAIIRGRGRCLFYIGKKSCSGEEKYINETFELVKANEEEKDHSVELSTGIHNYQIEYTLPDTLPSSFKTDDGSISYVVKFVIDRPWKTNETYKRDFTVIRSEYDLNKEPEFAEPVEIEKIKYFCCWPCSTDKIALIARIPQSGYIPGEKLPIDITVDNKSGTEIRKFEISFIKVISCFATSPSETVNSSEENILKVFSEENAPAIGTKNFQHLFEIPSVPQSSVKDAKTVSNYYELKITAIPENVCVRLPIVIGKFRITIGTVPLRSPPTKTLSLKN